MRVLVTGAAGFIGSHVVEALLAGRHEVRALDSFDPSVHGRQPAELDSRAEWITADVLDRAALTHALDGVEAVSHQAAIVGLERGIGDAPRYVRANDLGTAELLAACAEAGMPRFVLASSMAVYGEGAYVCECCGPRAPSERDERDLRAGRFDLRCVNCGGALDPVAVTEERPPQPQSVYAATKLHQEHLAFAASRLAGIAVTGLRYHNVYGPRMPRNSPYAGVASIFRSYLAEGRAPRVFEDGGQRRDFVHVSDVAHANVLAIEREDAAIGVFNIGSGEPRTILDLARALHAATGGPAPIVTGQFRPGDVRHIFASSERAARVLGYRAATLFADGIAELAQAPLREPVV
ncbi:MAG: NAD-dependent dehydratase [Chloroflexi bacterium 13_1_40CM_4_68_4]|nr:MAG: NAD-dependent dehydratase [Chloroflexi bacterium 13_1_40CM_4_68_4]